LILTAIAASTQAFLFYCSNRISREAYTAVQRAFVNIGSVGIEREDRVDVSWPWIPPMLLQEEPVYWFTPVYENDGSTPTRYMTITAGVQGFLDRRTHPSIEVLNTRPYLTVAESSLNPVASHVVPDDPESLFQQEGTEFPAFIGPHGHIAVTKVGVPEDYLKWSVESGWNIFMFGEIRYKDILDPDIQHVTQFCYVLKGETNKGIFTPRTALCGYWNCADDECESEKNRFEKDVKAARTYRLSR
jgi:hypothetical protein